MPRESAILVFSPPLVSENFSEMSQLGRTEFDNLENSSDHYGDNSTSFNDVAQVNDGSLDLETALLLLGDIEKDVPSQHEITVLFNKFNESDSSNIFHKLVLKNLFAFVCAIACDKVRCGPKMIRSHYLETSPPCSMRF